MDWINMEVGEMSYLPAVDSKIDHGGLVGLTDDDHPQYVKDIGDTMSGNLIMNRPGSYASLDSIVRVKRDLGPDIIFEKNLQTADQKKWRIYISGAANEGGTRPASLSFAALNDIETVPTIPTGIIRMGRDGSMLLGADPTIALDAATKQYVDKGGVDQAGSRRHLITSAGTSAASGSNVTITNYVAYIGDTGNTGVLRYSSGTITLQEDAVVEIHGTASHPIGGSSTGYRHLYIDVNGEIVAANSTWPTTSNSLYLCVSTTLFMTSGSTIKLTFSQNSGETKSISAIWSLRRVARA